ncbi:MAG TPA: proteasome accessory factor PafA2 family protein [Armatimonadota bacterium]|jgi:proteasome accessory factor A
MHQRIVGLETEFGCFVRDRHAGTPEKVVEAVKDHAFYQKKLGLIDLHARNYAFEPARAGGFLVNGGRLYVDAVGSHEEYATAECVDLHDLVAHDRAGHRILTGLLDDMGLSDSVSFHNNSVDHFAGHTFGCHENYLVDLEMDGFMESLSLLMPFLVTRQIFAGVGRVGGHRINHNDLRNSVMTLGEHEVDYIWVSNVYGVEIDRSVDYQLSQRADHILRAVSSRVRFNRAIINPKWETYYTFNNLHRLHVLYGEANMSEYATFLKVGTTSAVLELIESKRIPESLRLRDPVAALKSISRDPSYRWQVRLQDGKTMGAIDLQRIYLSAAKKHLSRKDRQTDEVLAEWERVLDALERDPMELADCLDWVAKKQLFEEYRSSEGVSWQDDMMQSLDMEYHNINPDQGLFYGLQDAGAIRRITTDEQIEEATRMPPGNTRARGRSQAIRRLLSSGVRPYMLDWDGIHVGKDRHLPLSNPFKTYQGEVSALLGS